jgi:protein SCO1/2/putative membrane protein
LWLLAFAGMYVVWRGYRERSERPTVRPGTAAVAATGNGARQEPIRVRPERLKGELEPDWDPKGIADFSLTERSGKTITKTDLLGKPWAVSFIFTKCAGPCLTITGQMNQLQEQLRNDDVRLVTITVDPKRDTPEVLQKYADAFGADPEKWLFLTGDKDEIFELINTSFRQVAKDDPGAPSGFEVAHSANILHVDAGGVVRSTYDGRDPAAAAELVRALKKEAAAIAESGSALSQKERGEEAAAPTDDAGDGAANDGAAGTEG